MLDTVTDAKSTSRNTLRASPSGIRLETLRAALASWRAIVVCAIVMASATSEMQRAAMAMISGHGRAGGGVVPEVSDPCAVVCAYATAEFYVRQSLREPTNSQVRRAGVTPTRWCRAAC